MSVFFPFGILLGILFGLAVAVFLVDWFDVDLDEVDFDE